ncbi:rhodanese-like domain-containing protein [Pontibacter sp. E15-1]|uniref:rhodanese-like domain-containing protein n=1 Tax=Pontibacter sp. E15-1 TaxID=2919918 RepID=UPI001F4F49D1|nr:rhodanese-like domain-containing protein [Pontibacter sp. E15-1]MCJ8164356.1 rhodanese-like domain-containing protein [Pontibacter sp. E15-1]
MKKLSLVLVAGALLASCSAESASSGDTTVAVAAQTQTAAETAKAKKVDSQEAKALLAQEPGIVVLDVRTPAEFAAGHLQNATLVDISAADFSQRLQALDKSKSYLVYCAVGGRSHQAAQQMQQLGFKQVYDATEGFSNLKNAGVPVE